MYTYRGFNTHVSVVLGYIMVYGALYPFALMRLIGMLAVRIQQNPAM
jgi:hypothetical protein